MGKHLSTAQIAAKLREIEADEQRKAFEASLRALVGHRQGLR